MEATKCGQIDAYIAGLILLAAAPSTAMVFVWSNLVEGEPHFTLSQVALNDTIMVVAFAPIVAPLSACPRLPYHGTRSCCRSCFISSCR
jgi:ACR3 family arsenite efflux pump ArsB